MRRADGAGGSPAARVSVVIATLGGPTLAGTIERLNAGSLVPAEILICIPEAEAQKLAGYDYPNVKVVTTDVRGQVPQRVAGFRRASHGLVLQLDDDIVLEEACLAALVGVLESHGTRCAVAPSLRWLGSGEPVYRPVSPPALSKAFFWLLNGRSGCRPGSITRAGAEIGVYATPGADKTVEVEWLAGGCVLHRRSDLVLENYFPFAGKAYCEDLIHSFHLRKRGVRLLVSAEATAYLARPDPAETGLRPFVKGLAGDLRARRYYVELSSRSKARMYLFFLARIVRRVLR